VRGRSGVRYGYESTGCIKNVVTQQIIDSLSSYKFLKGLPNIALGWVALVFRNQEVPGSNHNPDADILGLSVAGILP
jgi:hypothetical protein